MWLFLQKWSSQYADASTSLADREKELDNVAELIEKVGYMQAGSGA